ncbi:MAG: T9SS type A sorting domain-containing protein [Chlorobi bacterium]|nr:T9SS type A sorting domain-containing protein [Chlorobiota bacterium]
MKTSIRILILLLAVNLSAFPGFGQNISQKSPPNKQIPVKINKNLLPPGFMAGLQIRLFTHTGNNDKSTRDFTYRMDTAVVYSNGTNPQRYIYSYDSAGNKVSTYTELTTNGEWEYVSKDSATYDSVGNRLTSLSKIWKDGSWVNTSLSVYTYAVNHNVVTSVGKIWATDHWVYSDSSHFTYNVNGNKVASYGAVWSDTKSIWISSSFNLFTYDSMGNLKLSLSEKWGNSQWVNSQMAKYTYDTASNLINGLVQNWGDTKWVNFYQESYTYDSVRNRLSYTGETWNDSVWVNSQHYDYTYNKFGRLEAGIGENWNGSTWVRFEKGQFTHNAYGGIEAYLYQKWKDDTAWRNISLSQYNYDSAGNAYLGNYFAWDTLSQNWLQYGDGLLQIYYNYSSKIRYFTGYQVDIKYNAPLSTGVNDGVKDVVSQYTLAPNPAMDHTTVSVGLKAQGEVNLSLYDITGKKVSNVFHGTLSKGIHRFNIPTAQLPPGLYFVSFLSGKQAKTMKLIVRK